MAYLADTSVLTRVGVPAVREQLRQLLDQTPVQRCALSDLQLGFSARNGAEWDRITRAAAAFPAVEVLAEDFRRASQVQRALAGAGLRGRKVPDLLIAAVAERVRLTVLHYDRDFEHIATITGQAHQWIVPAGVVD